MALTITTASTSVNVDAFRVVRDEVLYERRGELARGSSTFVIYGDAGERPTELVIECEIQEDDVPTTMSGIATILSAAKNAITVETPRGERAVNGITWHELRHQGLAATITLAFAPGNTLYEVTYAGETTAYAGASSVYAGEG